MKEIKCTVVTTTGTYKTQIYTFDGITTEDKIQQLNCSGIYNITGIIEEPETAETETEVQETETAKPETIDNHTKIQIIHNITNTFDILKSVEHVNDLRKNKLTLAGFHIACDVLKELGRPGNSTKTFSTDVADFFRRNGFKVEMEPEGVNYIISAVMA